MKEDIRYIGEFRYKDKELSPPSGIAMDNSGNIIISDEFNHRIQIYDAAGSLINSIGKKGNGEGEFYYPKGIAVDSEGSFYVADCWNHRVQKFSRGTHESGSWKFLSSFGSYGDAQGSFNEPYDIAIYKVGSREERIFVLDRCNHRIQVFDKNAALRGIIGQRGTVIEEELAELFDTPPTLFSFPAFEFPTGLALDSEGNIYVADSGNHRIVKLKSDGKVLLTLGQKGSSAEEFQYPHDIAIDDKDTIFVSDLNNNRIQAFTPDGDLSFSIDTGKDNSDKIASPTALSIDNQGRLYAGMGFDTRILIYEYEIKDRRQKTEDRGQKTVDISSIVKEIREVEEEIIKIKDERIGFSEDYIARQIKKENDILNPLNDDVVFDETLYSYEKKDRSIIRDMRHKLLIHKRLVTKSCDLLSQDNENIIKDYISLLISESRFLLSLLEERRNYENEAEGFFRDESKSKEENWKGFKIAIRKSDIMQDILPHIFYSLNLLMTYIKKFSIFNFQFSIFEERYTFAKIILYSSGIWDYILQIEENIKELMGMAGEDVPLAEDEGNKPLPILNLPITLTLADLTGAIFMEGRAIANWQLAVGNRQQAIANRQPPIANCQLPTANCFEAMESLKVKLEKLLQEREKIGEDTIKIENSLARLPVREEKMRLPVLNNSLLIGFHDRINHRQIGELLTAYQILSSMLIGIVSLSNLSDKETDKKIPVVSEANLSEIMKFNEAQIALTSKIKKQGHEEEGRYKAELDRLIFSLNSDKDKQIELKNAIFRISHRTGFAHLYSKRIRGSLTLYRQSSKLKAQSPKLKFDMSFGNYGKGKGEFNLPASIAVDKSGNLYVNDQNNHRIQKFDRDGKFILSFGGFGSMEGRFKIPVWVELDRDGNLLVSEWLNNRIQRFSPDGEFISSFGRQGSGVGEFNRPSGIAVDKDGFIYVADLGNKRIQKFSHDGKHISSLGKDTFKEPYAVCIIPPPPPLTSPFSPPFEGGDGEVSKGGEGGFVLVGELAGDRAIILDSNGNIVKSFGGEGTEDGKFLWIGSITNDKKGNIYIADFWNSRIQIFSKDFNFVSSFGNHGRGAGEFDGVSSIAITDEFLYGCDYFNHRIQRFHLT